MGETKYHIPPSQQRRIASEMAANAKTKKELVEAARVAGVSTTGTKEELREAVEAAASPSLRRGEKK